MSPWWTGIAPAQATVRCGGHRHALRWEDGALAALDHGDPTDEATLAALAGEPVPCLEILRAWTRRRADPRVLTLASRGPGDTLDIDRDELTPPFGGDGRGAEAELLGLLALGGGVPERLQATAAATWARRLRTGHARLQDTLPQLHAALYGRALATLRTWLGEPGLAIELTMADASGGRPLVRSGDGIAVTLPFGWLAEVWARGLAVVFGRLCVAAHTPDGAHWTLDTVGPDLERLQPIALSAGESA